MRLSPLVPVAFATIVSGLDIWGPAVSFGPSKSTIVYASTIIVPPAAPIQPKGGILLLWPGMSNGTGNLIQSTLDNWDYGYYCNGVKVEAGEWCAMASVFGKTQFPEYQHDGAEAIVKKDQQIHIEYKLGSDDLTWQQTVSDVASNKVLSTLTTKSGPYMRGWGTGVECQKGCNPPGAHSYLKTTFQFKEAEPGFTMDSSQGATFTTPVSSQGGKVWTIEKINIPATKKPS